MKKLLSSFLLFIFLFSSCNKTSDIIVIGHRGAMGHALENTIESVEKAINLKVDGIEIDVFKSKSGELIVYHDPSLSRLSNSAAFIEDISLDSIKKIKLKGGLTIPILEEVIDLIPHDIFLNIELLISYTNVQF
jgi:glycerophosphoryl diester phosphodiesterase